MLWFFMFFIWIWLLIMVFGDIFRSHDLSGWAKALWVIFVIFVPYLGVFVYLIARGHKMHEHAVRGGAGAGRRGRQYIQQVERRAAAPPTSSPARRPEGQGRHRRRRVPAAQGQGARVELSNKVLDDAGAGPVLRAGLARRQL